MVFSPTYRCYCCNKRLSSKAPYHGHQQVGFYFIKTHTPHVHPNTHINILKLVHKGPQVKYLQTKNRNFSPHPHERHTHSHYVSCVHIVSHTHIHSHIPQSKASVTVHLQLKLPTPLPVFNLISHSEIQEHTHAAHTVVAGSVCRVSVLKPCVNTCQQSTSWDESRWNRACSYSFSYSLFQSASHLSVNSVRPRSTLLWGDMETGRMFVILHMDVSLHHSTWLLHFFCAVIRTSKRAHVDDSGAVPHRMQGGDFLLWQPQKSGGRDYDKSLFHARHGLFPNLRFTKSISGIIDAGASLWVKRLRCVLLRVWAVSSQ